MEMYVIGFKSIVLSSLKSVYGALGGLYRLLLQGADGREARTEAGRRAENDKQNYSAQALAACWQGTRYLR